MEDNFKKTLLDKWNTLYKKLKLCNDNLLNKSNNIDKDDLFIENSLLFYISSFGLSFIKNLYLNNSDSTGNLINMRCIIEGYAVLKYLQDEYENEEINILLFAQTYILERNTYRKYSNTMNGKLFSIEQMDENYNNSKILYKKILNLNSEKFNYLSDSNIPFVSLNYHMKK